MPSSNAAQRARAVGYLLAVVLVGGLGAICWKQQQTITALREQLHGQQAKVAEGDRLREELQTARGLEDQQEEIERLRENLKDLPRLRNEVTQLREENRKLSAANSQFLQSLQGPGGMPSNQIAAVTAARRMGSILGVIVRAPANGQAGVEVTGVDRNSPIATAGIAVGDIILALNGQRLLSPGELQTQMLTHQAGETVILDVLRTNAVIRLQTQTRAWP